MGDRFINLKLGYSNMDIYYPRVKQIESIKSNLKLFKGKFLDAGCGEMPYRNYILKHSEVDEYIGLDFDYPEGYNKTVKPDVTWDGVTIPIDDNIFESAMSTSVLEHCPDPSLFLKEVNRVLKKGGSYYVFVPFLWNLHDAPHDEFRFTPFSLERLLKDEGFTEISINATGGWHGSMATMLGAYACRAPMSKRKRNIFKRIAFPLIKYLINKGKNEKIDFMRGVMIPGLVATCVKG